MNVRTGVIAAGLVVLLAVVALQVADRIASRRIAAVLDHGIALLPPGIGAKYAGVSYSFLTRAVIVTGVSFTASSNGASGTETIDRIEVAGGSWELGNEMARLAATPTNLTRDTVLPVADVITLTGIRSQAPNLKLSLASVSVVGARLRPWALFQPGIPRPAEIIHQVTSPPHLDGANDEAAALAQAIPLMRFGAAMILALDYDSAAETGLDEVFTIPGTADYVTQQRHISLARASLTGGLHGGRLGSVHDEGFLESFGGNNELSIASLDFAGGDLRAPAEQLVAGAALTRGLLDGLKIGDITVTGVTARLPVAGALTITRIGIDSLGFGHGVLESAHAGVEQLHLTDTVLARTPAAAAAMQSLDLHALTISAAVGYRWDVGHEAVTLDRTELRIDELGDLGFDGRVEGVSPSLDMQSLRDNAVVREGRVRYRDASLARRLIAASAVQAQTDIASMRERLVAAIQQRAATLGSGPAVANLVSALTDFIESPTSLTLTMKPPVPLPLSDLLMQRDQDPQTLLDRLGVTFVANQ